MTNHYKTLGVPNYAPVEEIKTAYRKLSKKFHPDVNDGDKFFEERFKEIQSAYEILNNPAKKARLDSFLRGEQADNQYQSSHKSQTDHTHTAKPNSEHKARTPKDILSLCSDIRKRVVKAGRSQINETGLYHSLSELLNDDTINFLLSYGDVKTNKLLMNEVLICCSYIDYNKAEKLIIRLAKIAGSDNQAIILLRNYSKKLKRMNVMFRYRHLVFGAAIIIFVIVVLGISSLFSGSAPSSSAATATSTPQNGDLNNSFSGVNNNVDPTPEEQLNTAKNKLVAAGWEEQNVDNGQLPTCYNFKPKRGEIKNYLEVHVGGGTDVAVKVMNSETGKCVRFVFVNSGTTYKITNIPEGIYYLKLAYGKEWYSKVENGLCVGKFLRNPIYEKGQDLMDFNVQPIEGGVNVPSFELKLDVIASDVSNSFNSQNISEEGFNE
ncbi:MAG: hypothetical protein K0S09_3004 [Sphingobacteriaceae bacterium]|jgi:curved DNA-binding protein CbpA|nr:hypothetical protein [Sphingobacteriaceae bacterium]